MEDLYQPISCDYHDQLEAAASHHRQIDLEIDSQGTRRWERVTVADVYTRDGAEWVRLEKEGNSLELRLDHIVNVREL